MQEFVEQSLKENNVWEDYVSRPAYQQNDYVWWINDAKKMNTKKKRLNQIIEELRVGGIYMGMDHPPSRKK